MAAQGHLAPNCIKLFVFFVLFSKTFSTDPHSENERQRRLAQIRAAEGGVYGKYNILISGFGFLLAYTNSGLIWLYR